MLTAKDTTLTRALQAAAENSSGRGGTEKTSSHFHPMARAAAAKAATAAASGEVKVKST